MNSHICLRQISGDRKSKKTFNTSLATGLRIYLGGRQRRREEWLLSLQWKKKKTAVAVVEDEEARVFLLFCTKKFVLRIFYDEES